MVFNNVDNGVIFTPLQRERERESTGKIPQIQVLLGLCQEKGWQVNISLLFPLFGLHLVDNTKIQSDQD